MGSYWIHTKKRLDYIKTFVGVFKFISYKCLFIIRVKRNYQIRHIDVIVTFSNVFFNKVFYVEQSHLFFTKLHKGYKLI